MRSGLSIRGQGGDERRGSRGVNGQHDSCICLEAVRPSGSGTAFERCRLSEVDVALHQRTATRVDYASSHSSLTLRRPEPAHTQLSNIRGNPDGHRARIRPVSPPWAPCLPPFLLSSLRSTPLPGSPPPPLAGPLSTTLLGPPWLPLKSVCVMARSSARPCTCTTR